ncbi:MAG: ribonuclease HI family protein [Candidatus Colwellbacteria bacterium]|nr:ribonuclease HI family protein [Candidatus Colwellbacteria bacterium]
MNKLIIYIDGGARGNPGPAAIGVVIGRKSYREQIGNTTNNVAEYKASIFALKKAKQLLGKGKSKSEIEIRTDSELLSKQLNAEYKIKDRELQPLFIELWNLQQDFKKVKFVLVPREKNREADQLVNKALDTLL